MDFIPNEYKSYFLFVLVFGLIYLPLSSIVGYLDLKKGTFKEEQLLTKELSPIWNEIFSKLKKLELNDAEILRKLSSN